MSAQVQVAPRLAVRNLSKTFGTKTVLSSATFTVAPGEVRGLVGMNGSGKSTIAKILTGVHTPDSGSEVWIDGGRLGLPASPKDLRRVGMAVVHQDLGLVDDFSALRNIRIGHSVPSRFLRRIRWDREAVEAGAALNELGAGGIDLAEPVERLSPADRAKVAIARALQGVQLGRGVVIFDESSRALPRADLEEFYEVVRRLASRGTAVVMVSHRLSEVLSVCDSVTVLRDGKVVAERAATAELDEERLARLLLGKDLAVTARRRDVESASRPSGPVVASIVGLDLEGFVQPVDVAFRAGEIVGFTGRPGSAFEGLPDVLAGAAAARGGTVGLRGKRIDLRTRSIRSKITGGIVVVPEKRILHGLALTETVSDNISLPRLQARSRPWFLGRRWRHEEAEAAIAEYGIVPRDPDALVSGLSGGNQQKVMLAKWVAGDPGLLVLHEPTQAVDVQAREDIVAAIRRVADAGTPVLIVSSELSDLARLCDRVLVEHDDGGFDVLADDLDEERIVTNLYGSLS